MIRNILILSLFFGLAYAVTLEKLSDVEVSGSPPGFGKAHDYTASDYVAQESSNNYAVEPTFVFTDLLHALAGYKSAALSLAVKAIAWIVKNSIVVIIGAIVTFGFCKLTGKCSLDYQQYEGIAQFRSLVTPERLATAERFLVKAVEKYATETKKGRPIKKAHSSS